MAEEAPTPQKTVQSLARLKPAFRKDGTITGGNAPGLNSGAAAMVAAERGFAETSGGKLLGRLIACGVAAVESRVD